MKTRKIIECVPNFSEGRDSEKIKKIAEEIKKIKGVKLLDISSDKNHNRTVITFAGEPLLVKRAAFSAIKKAGELIDMFLHKGKHPRIGATDVCPFIPVRGVTMADCVNIARELGREVGQRLDIPVYLYDEAAQNSDRKKLEDIRRGEYESLPTKLKLKKWKPDYGSAKFNSKSGATIIGAREFLIAFNVNLKSSNLDLAKNISRIIRHSGGTSKVKNKEKIRIPGVFQTVKAIDVDMRDKGYVQVSMNLTNYKIDPVHVVFEAIKRIAELAGVEIHSSEIIGLAPKEALKDILIGYLKLKRFDGKKQIIEEALS